MCYTECGGTLGAHCLCVAAKVGLCCTQGGVRTYLYSSKSGVCRLSSLFVSKGASLDPSKQGYSESRERSEEKRVSMHTHAQAQQKKMSASSQAK